MTRKGDRRSYGDQGKRGLHTRRDPGPAQGQLEHRHAHDQKRADPFRQGRQAIPYHGQGTPAPFVAGTRGQGWEGVQQGPPMGA